MTSGLFLSRAAPNINKNVSIELRVFENPRKLSFIPFHSRIPKTDNFKVIYLAHMVRTVMTVCSLNSAWTRMELGFLGFSNTLSVIDTFL